jgi:hypothetical protein
MESVVSIVKWLMKGALKVESFLGVGHGPKGKSMKEQMRQPTIAPETRLALREQ